MPGVRPWIYSNDTVRPSGDRKRPGVLWTVLKLPRTSYKTKIVRREHTRDDRDPHTKFTPTHSTTATLEASPPPLLPAPKPCLGSLPGAPWSSSHVPAVLSVLLSHLPSPSNRNKPKETPLQSVPSPLSGQTHSPAPGSFPRTLSWVAGGPCEGKKPSS